MDNGIKEKKDYIFLAKFFAVLLVLNSHLDKCYPIATLATGGALGNALFFFVSGYTWWNAKNIDFLKWYRRKLERILLPTIFTNLIYIYLFGIYKQITFLDVITIFIYPNRSWFCGAILLYAIGYYFLTKSSNKTIFSVALICIFTYITYYVFVMDLSSWHIESMQYGGLCRIMFYMLCMIAGLLYHRVEHYNNGVPCKIDLAVAIISFLAIYTDKYLMQKYEIFMKLQFLNQIFTFLCIVNFFSFLRKIEGKVKIPGRCILVTIAEYSWEIYITQTLIIPFCQNLIFPVNVIVIVFLISISARIVKDVTNSKLEYNKLKRKEDYNGLQ